MDDKNTNKKINWQPLRELALKTPYTMEYLSLMARRKQLKVKKVGRLWYSTLDAIRDFEKRMQEKKEQRRERMKNSHFKSGKKPLQIKVTQKTIFDQIQLELEDVLGEIRDKERKLREEYKSGMAGNMVNIKFHTAPINETNEEITEVINVVEPKNVVENTKTYLQKEKKETEELSEKLIMDLGKLLNTANQIQDDALEVESEDQTSSENQTQEEASYTRNTRNDTYKIHINHQKRNSHPENLDEDYLNRDQNNSGKRINSAENNVEYEREKVEEQKRDYRGYEVEDYRNNHAPFLSLNYNSSTGGRQSKNSGNNNYYPEDYYNEAEGEGSWMRVILFVIAGILIFISILFILFLVFTQ